MELIIRDKHTTILDFGCGKGQLIRQLVNNLKNIETNDTMRWIYGYDPAMPAYEILPNHTFDLVIANDVFEHFDPKEVDEELKLINHLSTRGIFANISCRAAVHHLPNGQNCHTTLMKPDEWLALMNRLFIGKKLVHKQYNEKNKNLRVYYLDTP